MLRTLFCLTWNLSMGRLDVEGTGLSCGRAGGNAEREGSAWVCEQGPNRQTPMSFYTLNLKLQDFFIYIYIFLSGPGNKNL